MKLPLLMMGFAAASLVTVPAQTFEVIHSFTNSPDGAGPWAGLVLSGGTLYGTTSRGGSSGKGTVFKVDTNGTGFARLTSLSSYTYAGLVLKDATLYGTTYGSFSYPAEPGAGTVFKIGTNGTGYTTLKDFDTGGGSHPFSGLVLSDSTLYGTTSGNTAFKVSTNGTDFTVIRTFTNSPDGWDPEAGLVLDGSTLYGTTCLGGSSTNGTVFKMDTNGTGYAILKSFSATNNRTNSDGANPYAGLVLSGSTLYGMTCNGGVSSNGVVFKVDTNGTGFAVLKHFSALINGTNSDGANPYAGLILDGSTLYGTASAGGRWANGTVFKINTDGTSFAVLKHFPALNNGTNSDGATPLAGLILSGNTFYGTTETGGSSGRGVVFSLTVPPEILVNDDCFGVRTNCFGFNVTGISNLVVVMEACTNLTKTNWVSLRTNTLGIGPVYFSDSKWTNYHGRFYRVRVQ
jgi:uncharacterized repeat protein (TIGR03803 family)